MENTTKLVLTESQLYYNKRMEELGVTDDNNIVELWQNDLTTTPHTLKKFPFKIFTCGKEGIDILVYSITAQKIVFAKEGSRYKINDYKITRLHTPKINKDGQEQKYYIPKGVPVNPFFPPSLLQKFEAKQTIDVLYLTEGYFKAFKASLHNIDCVGLPSITCLKNKETGELHEDVLLLIKECNVKRVVWLQDGDCRDISTKQLNWKQVVNGRETNVVPNLSQRPSNFFTSVQSFYNLTSKLENVERFFSHVDSVNIAGKPKGLDDLLIALPNEVTDIVNELQSFNKQKEQLTYTVRFNITYGLSKVQKYFLLDDVTLFYLHHVELHPSLKEKEFKFYGSTYKYSEKENKCLIQIPRDADRFKRIGDTYYEKQIKPDHLGSYYEILDPRDKTTITDDFGKEILKHIEKYKGFVNIPNHINYQPVIDGFYNKYSPIPHELEDGEYTQSIEFLKHIFGEDKIQINETKTVERWEMGLDYLTILYKHPTHILPILSLVSEARQTGKTKFLEWVCYLFGENAIVIGNQDLENKFNRHWNGKLIIGVDETKIDKHIVLERVKALSTSSFTIDEGKGKDQAKVPFFGHFILNSNNVNNFAHIDENEIRFWVIEVPTVKKRNVDLLVDLKEEAPAFLSFLSRREIICPRMERHWFETRLLRTDALKRIIDHSKPTIQKLLNLSLEQLFESTEYKKIQLPLDAIVNDLLQKKYPRDYVMQTLKQMNYKTHTPARVTYPRLAEKKCDDGTISIEAVTVRTGNAVRYYEFLRENFIETSCDIVKDRTIQAYTIDVEDLPF